MIRKCKKNQVLQRNWNEKKVPGKQMHVAKLMITEYGHDRKEPWVALFDQVGDVSPSEKILLKNPPLNRTSVLYICED